MEDRWDYLNDDYAEEKPFVKIKTNRRQQEEGYVEKPSKIKKKGRKIAQRFKEFNSPREESDNG